MDLLDLALRACLIFAVLSVNGRTCATFPLVAAGLSDAQLADNAATSVIWDVGTMGDDSIATAAIAVASGLWGIGTLVDAAVVCDSICLSFVLPIPLALAVVPRTIP